MTLRGKSRAFAGFWLLKWAVHLHFTLQIILKRQDVYCGYSYACTKANKPYKDIDQASRKVLSANFLITESEKKCSPLEALFLRFTQIVQELSQTHILCYRSQHWLLISANTVSLQPPHSVTQQLLMACIQQQQPVSAALYTALIKCSALYCMSGLKKVR